MKILNPLTKRLINANCKKGKFIKNYKNSMNTLIKLLKKSPVNYKIIKYRKYNDLRILIRFERNEIGQILGYYDLRRFACECEFYKYAISVSNFYSDELEYYSFALPDDLSIWKEFNIECDNYQLIANKDLKSIDNLKRIKKLNKKQIAYIKKNYDIF
jgi:hypothetical protein